MTSISRARPRQVLGVVGVLLAVLIGAGCSEQWDDQASQALPLGPSPTDPGGGGGGGGGSNVTYYNYTNVVVTVRDASTGAILTGAQIFYYVNGNIQRYFGNATTYDSNITFPSTSGLGSVSAPSGGSYTAVNTITVYNQSGTKQNTWTETTTLSPSGIGDLNVTIYL